MKKYISLILVFALMLFSLIFPILAVGDGGITLRIHYHRPDGQYENEYGLWEAWLWDPDDITDFEPPYSFEDIGGEKVVTVKVRTGTSQIGYIIRNGEWYAKDVNEDQFIDITGILSGTLDFYIESGVPGGSLVKGDDVSEGITILDSSYKEQNRNGRPEVVIYVSSDLPYEVSYETFQIIRRTSGEVVGIESFRQSGMYVYLELDQLLDLRSKYDILFEGRKYELELPEGYDRTDQLSAWYPEDASLSEVPDGYVRVHVWTPASWDMPTIYCWPGMGADGSYQWPGLGLTFETGDWYSALIPAGENYFIVSNYGYDQTDDDYYDIDAREVWIVVSPELDGSAAVYYDVCETPEIEYCYSSKQDSVRVQWTPVDGVDGYELRRSTTPDDPASFEVVKTITDPMVTTYTNNGLEIGVTYYYKIQSFVGDDGKTRLRSSLSNTGHIPAAPVFNEPYSNSSFRVRLRWEPMDGADGFQIWRRDLDGSYRVVKTLHDSIATAYSNVGLEAGKQYIYKMRAFYLDENGKRVYGPYSDEVKVGVLPAAPEVHVSSTKTGKVKLSWDRVSGADSYQIWMASSPDGNYKIVKSIKDGDIVSYTKTGLDSGRIYYFKVRACSTVDGKRILGEFSETIAVAVK